MAPSSPFDPLLSENASWQLGYSLYCIGESKLGRYRRASPLDPTFFFIFMQFGG